MNPLSNTTTGQHEKEDYFVKAADRAKLAAVVVRHSQYNHNPYQHFFLWVAATQGAVCDLNEVIKSTART